jgi:hypothetical protein
MYSYGGDMRHAEPGRRLSAGTHTSQTHMTRELFLIRSYGLNEQLLQHIFVLLGAERSSDGKPPRWWGCPPLFNSHEVHLRVLPGEFISPSHTYVRWMSSRMAFLVVCYCKKISSSVPCQSTGLRPVSSHMCCSATVYGWGRGSEIFPPM